MTNLKLSYLLKYEKPLAESVYQGLLASGEVVKNEAEVTQGQLVLRCELAVHEATYYMSVLRDKKLRDADEAYQALDVKPDSVEQILELLWCSLSACSKGRVPTPQEFIHHMDDMDAEAWGQLVKEVNPHWFGEEKKNDVTGEVLTRLIKYVEAQAQSASSAFINLPEKLDFMGDVEEAMQYYMWLEAIDWAWDINTIRDQPEVLMNDIALLASTKQKIQKIHDKQQEKK